MGAQPARRASWASELKRSMPAISPMNLAGQEDTDAGFGEQVGCDLFDQDGDLVVEVFGGAREFSGTADHVAGDRDLNGLFRPGQPV